ncbi:hypothetical protein CWE08_02090 [Aliidiomarina iranensis]|uniref:MSHA biogenesis protein MshJ n=1 Tax=Aliidiomarina iranensis TaxID=1434071 RepID=A0A432W2M4_9GAMM|nr:type II secretion system protein GspM [Aliidiomarina iranensis]RUO23458.1 hypothetical protein CWE08_02090 [Aliidiomarina iranensis]
MKEWLANAELWFSDREKREQYILAAVSILLVAWLGYILLIEPGIEEREGMQRQLQQATTQANSMEQQVTVAQNQLQADPNAALSNRQRQLASRNDRLNQQLDNLAEFIEPEQLLDWLQAMLMDSENIGNTSEGAADSGLTLRSFDTYAPIPFLEDSPTGTVYQHNVEVVLEGSYFAVRDYLQRLQDLPFGFYWQELDYQVDAYPTAMVRLRLYTLSQQARTMRTSQGSNSGEGNNAGE